MNQKKAKAIRQAVGFVPSAKRSYKHAPPVEKITIDTSGKPSTYAVTGTIKAVGDRAKYQHAKRLLARIPRF